MNIMSVCVHIRLADMMTFLRKIYFCFCSPYSIVYTAVWPSMTSLYCLISIASNVKTFHLSSLLPVQNARHIKKSFWFNYAFLAFIKSVSAPIYCMCSFLYKIMICFCAQFVYPCFITQQKRTTIGPLPIWIVKPCNICTNHSLIPNYAQTISTTKWLDIFWLGDDFQSSSNTKGFKNPSNASPLDGQCCNIIIIIHIQYYKQSF